MSSFQTIVLCFALFFSTGWGNELPVSYKGRFRPLEVYERLTNHHEGLSDDLKMIPDKRRPGEWHELEILKQGGANPSLFSDDAWKRLQTADSFYDAYFQAYEALPPSHFAFPSRTQLAAEVWYYRLPLANLAIFTYLAALFFFILSLGKKRLEKLGWGFFIFAFSIHTAILALKTFILGRPPVSNMGDTLIYVPWIAAAISFFLSKIFQSPLPAAGASALGAILLTLLEWTLTSNSLENVQAVLNSQFWLIVHVLMIVASYGALILAGVLGHIALFQKMRKRNTHVIDAALLQSIYLGVALLIPGTILGGIWAAQSWGRFWDWDPKEAWAFISACTYLIVVHAHRFNYIGSFGLAIGSIVGLIVISFTWYGVNYILGTGLHSYGFGSGGEIWYYGFVFLEVVFMLVAIKKIKKNLHIPT